METMSIKPKLPREEWNFSSLVGKGSKGKKSASTKRIQAAALDWELQRSAGSTEAAWLKLEISKQAAYCDNARFSEMTLDEFDRWRQQRADQKARALFDP